MTSTLLLIHGGLWDEMDAERFWTRPPGWPAEAARLEAFLPEQPVTVVSGPTGCRWPSRWTPAPIWPS